MEEKRQKGRKIRKSGTQKKKKKNKKSGGGKKEKQWQRVAGDERWITSVSQRVGQIIIIGLLSASGLTSALIPVGNTRAKYESGRVWFEVDTLIIVRQIELSRCARPFPTSTAYTGFRSFPPLYASSAKWRCTLIHLHLSFSLSLALLSPLYLSLSFLYSLFSWPSPAGFWSPPCETISRRNRPSAFKVFSLFLVNCLTPNHPRLFTLFRSTNSSRGFLLFQISFFVCFCLPLPSAFFICILGLIDKILKAWLSNEFCVFCALKLIEPINLAFCKCFDFIIWVND